MSSIEIVAVVFGFLCVFFTIRENIWCWPTGLVQVFLYIFVFYDAKLYSDVILHIIYVFMQFYGWYFWLHGGRERDEAKVTTMNGNWQVASLLLSIAATLALGHFMATRTDASFPYADAFTTAFSLAAQWLMSRKKLESWFFWIAVDVVAIWVYYSKALHLTAGLYTAFLVMAIIGLLSWKKSWTADQIENDAELPEPAV
ncbi:MAG: nicotinamide riboside transporter PnuC [Candidatus Rifleibacteriota bacterium]